MPDPITPTDKTNPLDAGHTTTEYKTTKWIVVITTILGVLSAVAPFIEQARALFGDTKWIAIASVVIAGLSTTLYTLQRSAIKIAALKAGANVVVTPASADDAASKLAGG